MLIVLWVMGISFVWWLIGCVVCAAIDTEDQRLFKWAKSGPWPTGTVLVAMAWPLILYLWWKQKRSA